MARITEEELARITGKPYKKPKYNNKKAEYYDPDRKETLTFDSVKEYEYYLILKDRERKGEIIDLARQVEIEIQPSFKRADGKIERPIKYIADFAYNDLKRRTHYVDVKGGEATKTHTYKLKRKLLAYKGIYIEEV